MYHIPHTYKVSAKSASAGEVMLESLALPRIASQPAAEFGEPGDQWSPETLLAAAVADCFVLSFRSIANASKLEFKNPHVEVSATLDMVDRKMKFTEFLIVANLDVADSSDSSKAKRLLEKVEESCLVSNSTDTEIHLKSNIH